MFAEQGILKNKMLEIEVTKQANTNKLKIFATIVKLRGHHPLSYKIKN